MPPARIGAFQVGFVDGDGESSGFLESAKGALYFFFSHSPSSGMLGGCSHPPINGAVRDQIGSTLAGGASQLATYGSEKTQDVVLVAMDRTSKWVEYIVFNKMYQTYITYHTLEMLTNSAWYTSLEPGQIWITTQQYGAPVVAAEPRRSQRAVVW